MSQFLRRALALLSLTTAAFPLLAQDAPIMKAGSWEVGGYGGITRGEGRTGGLFGANFGYAATRALFPYVEFNAFPKMRRELGLDPTSFSGGSYETSITEVNTGIHYRLAARPGSRAVPYLIGGIGWLRYPAGTVDLGIKRPGAADLIVSGIPIASATGASANFGGGIRFYTNESFGIRFEAKVYKPFISDASLSQGSVAGTIGFGKPFIRLAVGLFWQSN